MEKELATSPKDKINADKEHLLKFMRDADCLESLSKWTTELNMFDILRVSRTEIRHSNMLGWLLDPNETHGLGDSFLYGIVSKISHDMSTDNALQFLSSDLYTFNVRREWNHIDILLVSNQCKLVLAIENKVGSHEHNSNGSKESQLVTYKNVIQSQFNDYTTAFVYLTPEGDNPSDDDWMLLDYSDVLTVLEKVYKTKSCYLSGESSLLIKNYINNIKKNVIMDQELVNLCNSIYTKHRRALDLIFENRDDITSQVSNKCREILCKTPGVELDESSRSKVYVKFWTKGLKNLFGDIDRSYYYYQFEIRADQIILMLEFHKEKNEELTDEISDKMKQAKSIFDASEKTLKKDWKWNRVWTERTDDLFDEKWTNDRLEEICEKDGTQELLKSESTD